MKINLVEDERSYVNQVSIYDSKEEISPIYLNPYNFNPFQNSQ